jgi:tetratricopeptide (TPR) repeat protein
MGRHQEALAEIKRAQELDPLRLGLRQGEVWCLMAARRYDESIEKQKQNMDMNPGHGFSHVALGLMYDSTGLYQEAIKEYEKAKTILGETTSVEIYLGYALAMTGQRSKSKAIFDKLSKGKEYFAPSELAYFHIAWKDKEAAMALLEKAYAARDPHLRNLKIDPHYDTCAQILDFKICCSAWD